MSIYSLNFVSAHTIVINIVIEKGEEIFSTDF